VLQGERELAFDNRQLHVSGWRAFAAARVPQVEVSFDVDDNGILNVSARDQETAAEQGVTICRADQLGDGQPRPS
jgi:molecular chaperone DnaK